MTISGMDKKEYDSNGNLLYYIEGDAIVYNGSVVKTKI